MCCLRGQLAGLLLGKHKLKYKKRRHFVKKRFFFA